MPLYQKRGHDGFFIIREVSAFWLELSAWLKNNFSHSILRYLPGVKPYSPNGYLVNMDNTLVGIDDLLDRKSTRLNSSHVAISYAVFCLKKKKQRSHAELYSSERT